MPEYCMKPGIFDDGLLSLLKHLLKSIALLHDCRRRRDPSLIAGSGLLKLMFDFALVLVTFF